MNHLRLHLIRFYTELLFFRDFKNIDQNCDKLNYSIFFHYFIFFLFSWICLNKYFLWDRALLDIKTVPEVRQFFKSGLSGNRAFSFPDARLLTLLKIEKKSYFFFKFFFSIFFFVYLFDIETFDTKFVSRDLILWELITCTW